MIRICAMSAALLMTVSVLAAGGSWNRSGNTYHHRGEELYGVKSGMTYTFTYDIGPPGGYSFETVNGGELINGRAVAVKTLNLAARSENFTISMSGKLKGPGSGDTTISFDAQATGLTDFVIEESPTPATIFKTKTAAFSAYENAEPAQAKWSIGSTDYGTAASINSRPNLEPAYHTVTATSVESGKSANTILTVYDVVHGTVLGAEEVRVDDELYVYAAEKEDEGEVTITLTVTPSGVTLEEGTVSWTGGEDTGDQLSRKVSKAGVKSESISANVEGVTVASYRIYICELQSETVATTPTDRSRLKVGVGEETVLTIKPDIDERVRWSSNIGILSGSGTDKTRNWTAGVRASTGTITATIGGLVLKKDYTVVEPSGLILKREPNIGIWHVQGTASVGFYGRPCVQPADVSFYNIYICEGEADGFGTGYFEGVVYPHPGGDWFEMIRDVTEEGTMMKGLDRVQTPQHRPPFSNGSFRWAIPWYFIVQGSAMSAKQFVIVNHTETLDAIGNITLSKGGLSITVNAEDPDSNY